MSDDLLEIDRQRLDNRLQALDRLMAATVASRAPIEAMLRPILNLEAEIEEQRAVLLENAGFTEIIGRCETCGRLLLPGDRGSNPYSDETGMYFCEAHSMTYRDLQLHTDELAAIAIEDGDDERAELIVRNREAIGEHLAAGGSLDDKHTWVLDL